MLYRDLKAQIQMIAQQSGGLAEYSEHPVRFPEHGPVMIPAVQVGSGPIHLVSLHGMHGDEEDGIDSMPYALDLIVRSAQDLDLSRMTYTTVLINPIAVMSGTREICYDSYDDDMIATITLNRGWSYGLNSYRRELLDILEGLTCGSELKVSCDHHNASLSPFGLINTLFNSRNDGYFVVQKKYYQAEGPEIRHLDAIYGLINSLGDYLIQEGYRLARCKGSSLRYYAEQIFDSTLTNYLSANGHYAFILESYENGKKHVDFHSSADLGLLKILSSPIAQNSLSLSYPQH